MNIAAGRAARPRRRRRSAKTVWKMVRGTARRTYFNGDKVVFATAKTDADAESIFSSLP
jgi:hypothetical protein